MGGLVESIQKMVEVGQYYAKNELPSWEQIQQVDIVKELSHGTGREIKVCNLPCFICLRLSMRD